MRDNLLQIIEEIIEKTTIWEWFAVSTGILYVIFVSLEKRIAWFFALINSSLYVYLCIFSRLYIDAGLQLFYVFMAFLGWFQWQKNTENNSSPIIRWSIKQHVLFTFIACGLSFIVAWIFDLYTNQASSYLDAFVSMFSLGATYMVVKKVLENWLYWIVIDLVTIVLYTSRELYLSTVLFLVYTLIAIYGYKLWLNRYKRQNHA